MNIKKVVVAGGGVLGTQIAYQAAYCGFDTTIWLRSEGSIGRTQPKIDRLHTVYLQEMERTRALLGNPMGAYLYPRALFKDFKSIDDAALEEGKKKTEEAYKNLKLELDMAKAFEDADIVIESMTENKEAKIEFYQKAAPLLPEKTILCTNSSMMLPSTFAQYTGRPEKYCALHFANEIWKNNTAEVMGHPGTDQAVYNQVVEFAAAIGMVPLQLHKEQPGYILNSMLTPFLRSALGLMANEVSDPQTIDLTWKLATGAPAGPFQIMDIVGLKTPLEIIEANPASKDPGTEEYRIVKLLQKYIDEGKLGVNAGEGFYKYNK